MVVVAVVTFGEVHLGFKTSLMLPFILQGNGHFNHEQVSHMKT